MIKTVIIRRDRENEPHNLIARLSSLMSDYQMPVGIVKMPQKETGALVGVILYLLEKEAAARTKIESQMRVLDNMGIFEKEETKEHIFHFEKRGKEDTPDIEGILNFMMAKKLLSQKQRKYYVIKHGVVSVGYFPEKLRNFLDLISEKLRGCTVEATKKKVNQWINERVIS